MYKENNDEYLFQFVEYDDALVLYQWTNIPEPQKKVAFSQWKSLWSENIKIGTPNNNTTLYVSNANDLVSRDINSTSDTLIIRDGDVNISCKSVVFVDDEVEVLNLPNVKEIHQATVDPTTNIIVKRYGNSIISRTYKGDLQLTNNKILFDTNSIDKNILLDQKNAVDTSSSTSNNIMNKKMAQWRFMI